MRANSETLLRVQLVMSATDRPLCAREVFERCNVGAYATCKQLLDELWREGKLERTDEPFGGDKVRHRYKVAA